MITNRIPLTGAIFAALLIAALPATAQSDGKAGVVQRGGGVGCADLVASGATWNVCDSSITTNGQPAGGSCNTGATGSGASIDDATAFTRSDAFDFGGMFWINNTQVGGIATYTPTSASFAQQTIAGLNSQLRYDALASQPTLRALLRLSNPGAAPITVTVDYATNHGSDGSTVIRGSSSGDLTFTAADRWVVTSDNGPSDPVNTTVIYSGNPSIAPSTVSNTVFSCAGTEGSRATYSVTVPAGETVALLTFQRLGDTVAQSVTDAAGFSDIQAGSPLLTGLSPTDLAAIRNIGAITLGPPAAPTSVPIGGGTWTWLLIGLLALAGLSAAVRFVRR